MTSIDRKLHRIILEAGIQTFPSAAALARSIESKKLNAFSYVREGERHYSSRESIVQYVLFAQRVGFLSDDLVPLSPRTSGIRKLNNFRHWAGGKLLEYNRREGFGPDRLRSAVLRLAGDKRLPTALAIREELGLSLTLRPFRWCLQLQALLRERTLKIHREWLWIPRDTLR